MLLFLLILAIIALAIFVSLKVAFLIFMGIVAIVIIAIALLVGNFIKLADKADEGHGSMDKFLFGDE